MLATLLAGVALALALPVAAQASLEVNVLGGADNDELRGNSGRETLDGGVGNDVLDGELTPDPGTGPYGFQARGAKVHPDILRAGDGADAHRSDPADRTSSCERTADGDAPAA